MKDKPETLIVGKKGRPNTPEVSRAINGNIISNAPQNEQARSRKVDGTSFREVTLNALKSKSNKRDNSSAEISLIICKKCGKKRKRFAKGFCHSCYNKEWLKNPKFRKKHAEYVRKYAHQNRGKLKEKARERYKNPEERKKFLVRAKTVYSNEKTGICNDCKNKLKTEFHHLSYEPNIFIEICRKCHNKRHGRETYV